MPEITPIPNVGSQLDRAIVAYLISVGVGTTANIFEAHRSLPKALPCFVVKAFQGVHEPVNSGNEVWMVSIQLLFPAKVKNGQENPHANRMEMDRWMGKLQAAMLRTNDEGEQQTLRYTAGLITAAGRALKTSEDTIVAAANTDMDDFTLQELYYKGAQRGTPEDEAAAWVEIRTFECHACPRNLD